MKRPWAALGMVLALSVFMPAKAEAQQDDSWLRKQGVALGQNYPNPFNPETTIPFGIEDTPQACQSGKQYRVTIRIYNALPQLVAIPVLRGGAGGVGGGQPLENVLLPCGRYEAYWDGKILGTGREAASGVYLYRLEVDGRTLLKKMVVAK